MSNKVVGEIENPEVNFSSVGERRKWGIEKLEEFIKKNHGDQSQRTIYDNNDPEGCLTGIKILVEGKEFSLIETSHRRHEVILIVCE